MDKKLEKLYQSVDLIEKQIIVLSKKTENMGLILSLGEVTKDAKEVVGLLKSKLDGKLPGLKQEYDMVRRKLEIQQLMMLHLLRAMEEKSCKVKEVESHTKNIPKMVLEPVQDNHGWSVQKGESSVKQSLLPTTKPFETPMRMSLADYENSPYITKPRSLQFQFLDFEAHITPEEFSKIPQYMKGRETLDELRAFLEQTLISCFTEKYTLLYKKREAIRNPHDIEIWKTYKQQQNDFPGKFFITEGDIARKIGRLVDKKMNVKIQMLRHIGKVKESRKGKTVYITWIEPEHK